MPIWIKIATLVFAVFGAIWAVLLLLSIVHWVFLGAAVLGVGYLVFRATRPRPKALGSGRSDLDQKLDQLEQDIQMSRSLGIEALSDRRKGC